MIILEPKKIYKGTYQYSRRNNFSDTIYLYDLNYSIYQLDSHLELSKVGSFPFESQLKYNTVSFHPTEKTVAVILNDKSVAICDFNGNVLNKQTGLFESVFYSRDGMYIWAIEKLDEDNLCLSVFNNAGIVLTKHKFDDELYDSYPRFADIPNSDKIILELAAGQDGITLYQCEYRNSISIKQFIISKTFPNSSFLIPVWSPDCSKLFALENDEQSYAYFSYPQLDIISEQANDCEDEDQMPGYNMIYLKNNLLIVQNINERHFLFDPIKMERLDEIVFQGYEPVPTHQIFKNLKEDNTLYSRIVYFDRISSHLFIAKSDERYDNPVTLFIDEDSIVSCT